MAYPIRNKLKPSHRLLPEEWAVMDALARYDWDTGKPEDFVPMSVIYGDYLRCVPNRPLTPTQFGVALRRVFGLRPDQSSRRRVEKKLCTGIAFAKRGDRSVVKPEPAAPLACSKCGGIGEHFLDCTGSG